MGVTYCCGNTLEANRAEKSIQLSLPTQQDVITKGRPASSSCSLTDQIDLNTLLVKLKSNVQQIIRLQALARGLIVRKRYSAEMQQK